MKWRKIGLLAILFLFPLNVSAQSDCVADYCGSVPVMGLEIGGGTVTTGFFRFESGHVFHLRVRTSPLPGYDTLPTKQYIFEPGNYTTYNLLVYLFPDIKKWKGTVILDWASYYEPVIINHMVYTNCDSSGWSGAGSSRILQQYILPGCWFVPKPHDSVINLTFYNSDEQFAQTVEIEGELFIATRSPIGQPSLLDVNIESESFSVKVCVGKEIPAGPAGINYSLPLYLLPKFYVGDEALHSSAWPEDSP